MFFFFVLFHFFHIPFTLCFAVHRSHQHQSTVRVAMRTTTPSSWWWRFWVVFLLPAVSLPNHTLEQPLLSSAAIFSTLAGALFSHRFVCALRLQTMRFFVVFFPELTHAGTHIPVVVTHALLHLQTHTHTHRYRSRFTAFACRECTASTDPRCCLPQSDPNNHTHTRTLRSAMLFTCDRER